MKSFENGWMNLFQIYFLRLVIPKIGKIGAINQKLALTLQAVAPNASIEYIGHFVDDKLFQPSPTARLNNTSFVIGWAGDPRKSLKITTHCTCELKNISRMRNGSLL